MPSIFACGVFSHSSAGGFRAVGSGDKDDDSVAEGLDRAGKTEDFATASIFIN